MARRARAESSRLISDTRLARHWLADLGSLALGASSVLAFAPWSLYWLSPLVLAGLLRLWWSCSWRRAAWRGWLFGLGHFGAGVHWVYYSLHDYGHAAPAFAAASTLLLVAYLALYPAAIGALLVRCIPSTLIWNRLLMFPALWVLAEWLRERLLSGFPWLSLGYSQLDSPLGLWAPYLGVLGVGLLTALCAALLATYPNVGGRARFAVTGCLLVIVTSGWVLPGQERWVAPAGETLRASLVQGNVPQELKWRPELRERTLASYAQLTLGAPRADLVVWPETALPGFLQDLKGNIAPLARELREQGSDWLTGVMTFDALSGNYYNSVALFGATPGLYHKRHLVPFGEFLPLRDLLRFFETYVQIPMSDFAAGESGQSLLTKGHALGVSVCYEAIFGEQIREALPDARLLINVSNDGWFGDSLAPHQHLDMARMRARETGRYLLRATNTGISAIIDPAGKVIQRSEQFTSSVVAGEVRPLTGATPYVRYGQWPTMLIATLMAIVAVALGIGARGRRTIPEP